MDKEYIIELKNLTVSCAPGKYTVKNISALIKSKVVTSIIGPLGAGKTILLKSINRLNELNPTIKTTGEILLDGENIFKFNPIIVRRKIGMVFQDPNPFLNMNIYDNVLAGYKLNRISLSKTEKNKIVEKNLEAVALWDEIKDDLYKNPNILTKGQQQQLCIARTIAIDPELILMDDPTNILDAYHTNKIEELIDQLKADHSIILITKNLSQAARISSYTMFMEAGKLIEYEATTKLLRNPKDKRTNKFITNQV